MTVVTPLLRNVDTADAIASILPNRGNSSNINNSGGIFVPSTLCFSGRRSNAAYKLRKNHCQHRVILLKSIFRNGYKGVACFLYHPMILNHRLASKCFNNALISKNTKSIGYFLTYSS